MKWNCPECGTEYMVLVDRRVMSDVFQQILKKSNDPETERLFLEQSHRSFFAAKKRQEIIDAEDKKTQTNYKDKLTELLKHKGDCQETHTRYIEKLKEILRLKAERNNGKSGDNPV